MSTTVQQRNLIRTAASGGNRPDADVRNKSVGVLRFARPRKKNEWYRKWSEYYDNNCPQGVRPNLAGFRDPSAKKCAEDPY
jgi:hypothetical protein